MGIRYVYAKRTKSRVHLVSLLALPLTCAWEGGYYSTFYCVNSCSFVTLFPGSRRTNRKGSWTLLGGRVNYRGPEFSSFLISFAFSKRRQRSLCRRINLTPVSDVCEVAAIWPISLLLAPSALSELPEVRFEFLFNLIGKLTMAHLTGQSWRVIKSHYTGGGPEQGYWHCCADRLFRPRLFKRWIALSSG